MKMKFLTIIIIIFAAMFVAGCNGGAGGTAGGDEGGPAAGADTLSGAAADILQEVMDAAGKALGEADAMPATLTDPITAENAPGMIGLTPDDFVSFVEDAAGAIGALNVMAFQAVVLKCANLQDAELVNGMILVGYDSGKWICVFPEQSLTMVSGSYLLLAVGRMAETDALAEAFTAAAGGNADGPFVFYTGETGGGILDGDFDGDIGFGLEIDPEDFGELEIGDGEFSEGEFDPVG